MLPVALVALACVGVVLNLFSDKPILLRHPKVQKLVSDSSHWTSTNSRRFLEQQQRNIEATKRVYRKLSDDNWAEARLRMRRAAKRARLWRSAVPPTRDIVVYRPFEVQVYDPCSTERFWSVLLSTPSTIQEPLLSEFPKDVFDTAGVQWLPAILAVFVVLGTLVWMFPSRQDTRKVRAHSVTHVNGSLLMLYV